MSLLQEGLKNKDFQRLFPDLATLAEEEPAFVQGALEGINSLVTRANALQADDPLLEILPATRALRQRLPKGLQARLPYVGGESFEGLRVRDVDEFGDRTLDWRHFVRWGTSVAVGLMGINEIASPSLRTSGDARLASVLAHFYEQSVLEFLRSLDPLSVWEKDTILTPLCEVAMLLKAEGRENSLHGFIFSPWSPDIQGGLGWEGAEMLERFLLSYQLFQLERKVDPLEDPRATGTLLGCPVEFGSASNPPIAQLKISGLEGLVSGRVFSFDGAGPGPQIVVNRWPEDRKSWRLTEPFYPRRVVEYLVEGRARILITQPGGKLVEVKVVEAADGQIVRLPEASILAYINDGDGPVVGVSLCFPAGVEKLPLSREEPSVPWVFWDCLDRELKNKK